MAAFQSAREAKDFLVSQIVEEAGRQNVPLSEVERKMLYFTETYESLPGIMDVAERFDAEYDPTEYEAKISHLIASTTDRLKKESPEDRKTWDAAVSYLRKEDHYILVMVDQGQVLGPSGDEGSAQKADWRDQLKLLAAGIVVAAGLTTFIFVFENSGGKDRWVPKLFRDLSDDTRGEILIGGMILLAVLYGVYDYLFPRLLRRNLKLK